MTKDEKLQEENKAMSEIISKLSPINKKLVLAYMRGMVDTQHLSNKTA